MLAQILLIQRIFFKPKTFLFLQLKIFKYKGGKWSSPSNLNIYIFLNPSFEILNK
jgi:hypothetical protein